MKKTILALALLAISQAVILAQPGSVLEEAFKLSDMSFDSMRTNPAKSIAAAKRAKQLLDESDLDQNCYQYAIILANWAQIVGQAEPAHLAEALAFNDRAMALYEKYPHPTDKLALSKTLNIQAILFLKSEKFAEADSCFRWNIELRRKMFPDGSKQLASPLRNYGTFLSDRGDYLGAEPFFLEALQIKDDTDGRENASTKSFLVSPGSNRVRMGDYLGGLKYLLEAYDFYEKNRPGDPILAFICGNIGDAYQLLGDHARAVPFIEKAISIPGRDPEKAEFFHNLGNARANRGEYRAAGDCFSKAMKMLEGLPPGNEERMNVRMFAAQNEVMNGGLMGGIGQLIALQDTVEKYGSATDGFRHDLFSYTGEAFLKAKMPGSALPFFQKALQTAEAMRPRHADAIAEDFKNLSLCSDGPAALAFADSAIEAAGYRAGQPFLGQVFFNVPQFFAAKLRAEQQLFESTGDPDFLTKIGTTARGALDALESCRAMSATDGSRQFFLEKNGTAAASAVAAFCLLFEKTGDSRFLDEAFQMAERAKTLSLTEAARSANAVHIEGVPDSLLAKKRQLETDLAWLDKTVLENRGASLTPANRTARIRLDRSEELIAVNGSLDQLDGWKKLRQPGLTTSILEAQKNLLETGRDVFMEFVIGEAQVFQFIVRRDTAFVRAIGAVDSLKIAVRTLVDTIAAFGHLSVGSAMAFKAAKAYIASANFLYQKLIAPVRAELRENVLVVADGFLGALPFDALLDGTPKRLDHWEMFPYLLRDFDFHYTWSAAMHIDLLKKRTESGGFAENFTAFAPFGKADTSLLNSLAALVSRSTGQKTALDPLRFSAPEAEGAAELMGGKSYSDTLATLARFLRSVPQSRILHLATHAAADAVSGDFAWLAFCSNKKDSVARLYSREIYAMQVPAELVVLSACDSQTGKIRSGEGVLSLARAFAWAGARSVIASQWRAGDATTERLMLHFYKNLKAGATRADALRKAKLSMLEKPSAAEMRHQPGLTERNWRQFANPFYWAGFSVMGNGRGL